MLKSLLLCPRRNGDWVPNWASVPTVQTEKQQPKIEGANYQDSACPPNLKSTLSYSQTHEHDEATLQSSLRHTIKSVDSILEVEAASAW